MAQAKRVDNKGRKLPDGFSQRPDGRYMARFTHCGTRYTLYDMNLNKLKEKVLAKKYELEHHSYSKSVKLTVDEWFDIWFESYYKDSVKPSTATTIKNAYEKRIRKSNVGNMKIEAVKNGIIVEFYKELSADGYATPTIKTVHSILKMMFETAIRNEMVAQNPTNGAISALRTPEKEERRVFSKKELETFFEYLKNDLVYSRYLPFYVVGFNTGMRVGELTGLTWDDIDFENGLIHVERTLYFQRNVGDAKARFHVSTPKTINANRTIPMLPEVKKALEEQKKIQDMMKFQGDYREMSVDGISNFVFTTRTGTPRKENDAWKIGKRIVKKMNEKEEKKAREENRDPEFFNDFYPHTMRHTFTSMCVEKGMSPVVLAKILGHSSVRTTLDIYTHVSDEQKIEEMKVVGNGGI